MKSKGVILTALLASSALAQTATLTMDEVSNQLINGLVINKGGIAFTFSNPGLTLHYNVFTGLGAETYVADPVIQGNNSAFGVAFSPHVGNFQFGFAVETVNSVASMATVSLFNNSSVPFAVFPLPSSASDPFSEGRFTYTGGLGPVTNILITPTGTGFTALVFDNLTVTAAPPDATSVPAASPLTLGITAICLAGLTMLLLRKQPA